MRRRLLVWRKGHLGNTADKIAALHGRAGNTIYRPDMARTTEHLRAYLQPPKSVTDYMAEGRARRMREGQLRSAQQRNALGADDAGHPPAAAAGNGDRNALQRIAMGWNADTHARTADRGAAQQ